MAGDDGGGVFHDAAAPQGTRYSAAGIWAAGLLGIAAAIAVVCVAEDGGTGRQGGPASPSGPNRANGRGPVHHDFAIAMISKDEEGAVGRVIDDLRRAAPGAEIVLVDSSRDRTPTIAEARGARVIRQFPPRGYGHAMMTALHASPAETVVTLDCDNTYPADKVVPLAKLVAEDGFDVVNATRLARRPDAMPLANYAANALFAAAASVACGVRTTDVHSGMRAYRTSMLRTIDFDPSGPALPVELWLKPIALGYRAAETPIAYFERIGDTTLQRTSGTVWTLRRIARVPGWRRQTRGRGALASPRVEWVSVDRGSP